MMRSFFRFFLTGLWLLVFAAPAVAQNYDDLFRDFRADGLTYADKRFLQTALAFEGHYNGLLDGDWGRLSQTALNAYARAEFGTGAEDWHMAALAFRFMDIFERDGWAIRHFDGLEMSMLYPYRAAVSEPSSVYFVNWRHANSSLAYSTGIHTRDTVQRLHDYTYDSHVRAAPPYTVRRRDFVITSAETAGGGILYTRSNYIDGAWHTVMLSAERRDVPILNAVAASISVGWADPVTITPDGKLDRVIRQATALLAEDVPPADQPEAPAAPSSSGSTGTGFVVSDQGHVLTNEHVVAGCRTLAYDGRPASVVAASEEFDLAIIAVGSLDPQAVARFSPTPARLNSDVTVVGYPLSDILTGLNVTRGAVSSQMGFGGAVGGMQITAPVQPGNSGGPVIAADGEVVGVVVSKLDAQVVADEVGDIPQNVNFAIRGELAKLFLFQHGIEPLLGQADDPLAPEDIAEGAAAYTGLITCTY